MAVILVLGRHAVPFPDDAWAPALFAYKLWARAGWMGVDLFFVLSGFLVSGLLFREYQRYREIRIGSFLIRRGFKIYPAFYVFILVCSLVQDAPRRVVLSEVFFVQNYFRPMWPHTWSLAVEEHFYLLLPALLLLLVAMNRGEANPFRKLPVVVGVVAASLLALRVYLAVHEPFKGRVHVFPTHIRIDSLLFGVLLAYAYNFFSDELQRFVQRHRLALVAAGTAAVLPPFFLSLEAHAFIYSAGYTCLYLGFGALMITLVVCGQGMFSSPSRWVRFWAYLGSHSYSVYLWHYPVWFWMVRYILPAAGIELHYAVECLVCVAACFGFGILAGKAIEFPMLRLRDRLVPARSRPVEAAG